MIDQHSVLVDGLVTGYLEAGQGEPVVLLHGGEFGANARIGWEHTIEALAQRYRVLAPDMLGFGDMQQTGYPVIFDVTHSLQRPGGRADSAGGRRRQVAELARAGVAVGLAGLFLEAHPDPDNAKCDGPCALALDKLEPFLAQLKALDELVKGFPALEIS